MLHFHRQPYCPARLTRHEFSRPKIHRGRSCRSHRVLRGDSWCGFSSLASHGGRSASVDALLISPFHCHGVLRVACTSCRCASTDALAFRVVGSILVRHHRCTRDYSMRTRLVAAVAELGCWVTPPPTEQLRFTIRQTIFAHVWIAGAPLQSSSHRNCAAPRRKLNRIKASFGASNLGPPTRTVSQ